MGFEPKTPQKIVAKSRSFQVPCNSSDNIIQSILVLKFFLNREVGAKEGNFFGRKEVCALKCTKQGSNPKVRCPPLARTRPK